MDSSVCGQCGRSLILARSDACFCSTKCRVYWHRAQSRIFPAQMRGRRSWVRADGKRPITVDGHSASTTDPSSWSSFGEVVKSRAGDGFGVMLGDGLGCFDLDHVSDAEAREFIATVTEPVLFIERSVSGLGVHVFIEADEDRGWRRGSIERYTRARFIRVTGEVFGSGGAL